jgi:hypothetical protein
VRDPFGNVFQVVHRIPSAVSTYLLAWRTRAIEMALVHVGDDLSILAGKRSASTGAACSNFAVTLTIAIFWPRTSAGVSGPQRQIGALSPNALIRPWPIDTPISVGDFRSSQFLVDQTTSPKACPGPGGQPDEHPGRPTTYVNTRGRRRGNVGVLPAAVVPRVVVGVLVWAGVTPFLDAWHRVWPPRET